MSRPTPRTASRTHGFTESVIRQMTRVAHEHGAVNLAQGFPDFPAPELLKEAARRAIAEDLNQYAITWGSPRMRAALEEKYLHWYGLEVDGDREITVTCGATEAMAAVLMAVLNPGDEVVVLEPFYENYGPDAVLAGAVPVHLRCEPPHFLLDADRLEELVTPRTRAVVINTPNNPTGRVFNRAELEGVARVCRTHDLLAVTDEIYEHIYYTGEHHCMAALPDMRDRTVVVSGASKTFSVTGWRVGTILAPADLTAAIRKVHDFLTVGSPAPLQEAVAVAMTTLGPEYYEELAERYRTRRDVLVEGLQAAGFRCAAPEGAYYVLADFSELSDLDDTAFAHLLAEKAGVASVPGSSFFADDEGGRELVRFAFCKVLPTLEDAAERLQRFGTAGG